MTVIGERRTITGGAPEGWAEGHEATVVEVQDSHEADGLLTEPVVVVVVHVDDETLGAPPHLLRLSAGWWARCPVAPEPVGLVEIAERLGVARQTVDAWQYRRLLPAPRWTVGGRPAWEWSAIAAWARETGRLTARE